MPPKSVAKLTGEKCLTILTCKRCNSRMGTKCQNDLKRFLIHQLHTYGKYDKAIPGMVAFEKAPPLRSNIIWIPQRIQMIGVPKANNPEYVQREIGILDQLVEQKSTNWKFTVELNYGYKLPAVSLACLHAAYLVATISTGYHYAYSKAGEQLRKLLSGNTQNMSQTCLIEPLEIGVGGKPWIAEITSPTELRCLWVKVAGNIVILPLPDDEGLSCYQAWQQVCDKTHFGMQPRKLSFRASFPSKEDAQEAANCLPGIFPSVATT